MKIAAPILTGSSQGSSLAWQVLRFAGVGVVATAIHIFSALCVKGLFDITALSANFAGFSVAVLVSFIGHAKFTFRVDEPNRQHLRRFLFLSLTSLLISSTITAAATSIGASFAVAMLCVGIVVPAASFLGSKYWAFSDRQGQSTQ